MLPIGFCLVTFGTSYSDLRRAAQHIDALGFDSIWVWDHYVSWNDPREPVLEGWTTLAALAEATQRVRIGPLVANNSNRHPGRLAKVVATLQEISGGRVELGLGQVAWNTSKRRSALSRAVPANGWPAWKKRCRLFRRCGRASRSPLRGSIISLPMQLYRRRHAHTRA